jgi:Tol biopolymer transport system component
MSKRVLFALTAILLLVSGCGNSTGSPSAGSSTLHPSPTAHPFAGEKAWVAYQTMHGGREGVWLVHPDGTENHQVATDVPSREQELPDWSPDGKRLVFTTRGGTTEPLYEYDLATNKSRQLFACIDPCLGDDEPTYSPDGTKVAFIRALGPLVNDLPTDCGLWIGDRATGRVQQVTSNTKPPCNREVMPRWSPDGKRLTYFREPHESGQPSITAVFVINADGKGARQLTPSEMEAGEPDWSRDGTWIVFATHPLHSFDCCLQSNLYRMHPDGSGMEQLTRYEGGSLRATQPRYTPDGKWIVFTAVTPSSRSLWAMPADGGKPVVIATGGFYTHGTWQPNS